MAGGNCVHEVRLRAVYARGGHSLGTVLAPTAHYLSDWPGLAMDLERREIDHFVESKTAGSRGSGWELKEVVERGRSRSVKPALQLSLQKQEWEGCPCP